MSANSFCCIKIDLVLSSYPCELRLCALSFLWVHSSRIAYVILVPGRVPRPLLSFSRHFCRIFLLRSFLPLLVFNSLYFEDLCISDTDMSN